MRNLNILFTEGMPWDNYGEWHMFVYQYKQDDRRIAKRLHYTNTQPLWASKGDRYIS